nr:hypothetical protein [Agrococcus sp. REN33]
MTILDLEQQRRPVALEHVRRAVQHLGLEALDVGLDEVHALDAARRAHLVDRRHGHADGPGRGAAPGGRRRQAVGEVRMPADRQPVAHGQHHRQVAGDAPEPRCREPDVPRRAERTPRGGEQRPRAPLRLEAVHRSARADEVGERERVHAVRGPHVEADVAAPHHVVQAADLGLHEPEPRRGTQRGGGDSEPAGAAGGLRSTGGGVDDAVVHVTSVFCQLRRCRRPSLSIATECLPTSARRPPPRG